MDDDDSKGLQEYFFHWLSRALLRESVFGRLHLGQTIQSSENGDDTQLLQAWHILRDLKEMSSIVSGKVYD